MSKIKNSFVKNVDDVVEGIVDDTLNSQTIEMLNLNHARDIMKIEEKVIPVAMLHSSEIILYIRVW